MSPGAGRISTCRTRRRARPPCGPRSTRPTFRPVPNGIRKWNRPPARTLRASSPSSRRRVLARCACRGWASRRVMPVSSPVAAPVFPAPAGPAPVPIGRIGNNGRHSRRVNRRLAEHGTPHSRSAEPVSHLLQARGSRNRAAGVPKGRSRVALSARTTRSAVEPPTACIRGSRTAAAAGLPSPHAGSAS